MASHVITRAERMCLAADVVITMGCGDACPLLPGKHYENWELDDPAGKTVEEIRPIRDRVANSSRSSPAASHQHCGCGALSNSEQQKTYYARRPTDDRDAVLGEQNGSGAAQPDSRVTFSARPGGPHGSH
jgi:hypothetical protein